MDEPVAFSMREIRRIIDLMEQQFGPQCEIVLHDLNGSYEHTIVDIRNGHVTGRRLGDCGSNLGLELIRGTIRDGDRFNYITRTRDGKTLRSSTAYMHDDQGRLYSLCVNVDITPLMQLERCVQELRPQGLGDNGGEEIFVNNVGELIEFFLRKGEEELGCQIPSMNREDKIRLLEYLDKKGAFLIAKSGKRVCEALGISKFTLYNYLEIIRKNGDPGNASADSERNKLHLDFEE